MPTEAELAREEGRNYEPADVLLKRILEERKSRWIEDAAEQARAKAEQKAKTAGKRWTKSDDQAALAKGRQAAAKKYTEPEPPDASELPDLPEGWCWTNLSQLKLFSLYGPRFSSDDYAEDGQLVLRTSDISEGGKVNIASAPKIALSPGEFSKYRVELGDLLVTRTGSLGTLAVFNDVVDAIPGAYLIQFRLAAPRTTSWYCFIALKSPDGQARLSGGGAGVGRPNLNAPTIEAIPIPLPPLAEQARISEEIQRVLSIGDEAAHQVGINLARNVRLRQSILKWAFEGRLVDQDPDDEPASVLLERIKAERVKAAATNGKTKREHGSRKKTSA